MNITRNHIAVGDLVINKHDKYIGTVTNKNIVYFRMIACNVEIDQNQTRVFFKKNVNNTTGRIADIEQLQLIDPISLYNRKIIKPKFDNLIEPHEIKVGRVVKIVDNFIFEKYLYAGLDGSTGTHNMAISYFKLRNFYIVCDSTWQCRGIPYVNLIYLNGGYRSVIHLNIPLDCIVLKVQRKHKILTPYYNFLDRINLWRLKIKKGI